MRKGLDIGHEICVRRYVFLSVTRLVSVSVQYMYLKAGMVRDTVAPRPIEGAQSEFTAVVYYISLGRCRVELDSAPICANAII